MRPRLPVSSTPSIREIVSSILTTSSSKTCLQRTHSIHPTISSGSSRCSRPLSFVSSCPARTFHTQKPVYKSSPPPRSHDRGPPSSETTQTDFSNLDVLGSTPVPSTAIDACLWDGFHLNNGVKISGGAGVLLVSGEAFAWRPWEASKLNTKSNLKNDLASRPLYLLNRKGQFEVLEEAWGILALVHPKPDLLILGVGPQMVPLSPATRSAIARLGIRVDVQDTRNASAQFNLLATERGVGSVAAGLVPVGWREGKGIVSNS